jgi:hypothetical protein
LGISYLKIEIPTAVPRTNEEELKKKDSYCSAPEMGPAMLAGVGADCRSGEREREIRRSQI